MLWCYISNRIFRDPFKPAPAVYRLFVIGLRLDRQARSGFG